jgi:serine/threonine protein kinase
VILFVLLAGYLPFEESTTAALFNKIKTADFLYPDWFTPGARELLDAVLVVDPKARLSLAELAAHPWMQLCEQAKEKLMVLDVSPRMRTFGALNTIAEEAERMELAERD